MRSKKPMKESSFGWWLVDIEDELQSCSHMPPVRSQLDSICLCTASNQREAENLRRQQLVSPTSLPSRSELLQLIKCGRLGHLERHQNVLETILGAKSAGFTENPEEESATIPAANAALTSSAVIDDDDEEVDKVLDDALRSEHMDADLVKQVQRIRGLRADLSHMRCTTRALQRDLQGLDSTASRILSSVRGLRRDVDDLCFLERVLAAADGCLPCVPSRNLII